MANRKVLWVGWDGADWEHITPLLETGQLPNLQRLIVSGVMGNLATLQPVLSPMLWNSAATGKQADKHGILGFVEPDQKHGGARPFQSTSRKTKAIWNILSQNGLRSNVVNWWASHPAESINGCVVSNLISGVSFVPGRGWKIPKGLVHPQHLEEYVAQLKVLKEEITGEELLPFVPRANEVNQNDDPHLAFLADHVAEMTTTHAIATALMERESWDFMAVYLTAIDHICHSFMSYYPPKLPWVPQQQFDLYSGVVDAAYRFSDMMLGRLMQLAGPDTTILLCSDHGFQSGPLRLRSTPNEPAGPAYWHRHFGIFLASGPGIKKDERIYGASLIDICPTILQLFDLPIGKDMDGNVLADIFEQFPEIKSIASWDPVDGVGSSGMHVGEFETTPEETHELFQQFVALGYVDAPGETSKENFDMAEIESKFNLARNLAGYGKNVEACAIFLELVRRSPWESRFLIHLAKTLIRCGDFANAEWLLKTAYDNGRTSDPNVKLMFAELEIRRKEDFVALQRLLSLEDNLTLGPGILVPIGTSYLQMRRWKDAHRVFSRILKIHADNAEAWQGLSSVYVRQGLNQEAVEAALNAVSLTYQLPHAHLNLGIALARGGDSKAAIIALNTALRINPNIRKAHRLLALIYSNMAPDREKADFHRRRFQELKMSRVGTAGVPVNSKALDLPEIPSETEREAILAKKRPLGNSKFVRSGKEFVLVSGLPRSGTSLMMQMLEAGGLPPQTDGLREADNDNPQGYYEWEDIKHVGRKPELFDTPGLEEKAIKVVSPLLSQLPYQHDYKVVFMNRSVEEVAASQKIMIERRQSEGSTLTIERLQAELEAHRSGAIQWLKQHPRAKVLEVDYVDLLENPKRWIPQIVEFVGASKLREFAKMELAIDKSLRRNRRSENVI